MNKSTVNFFTAMHYMYSGNEEAIIRTYALVSTCQQAMSRGECWNLLEGHGPELIRLLRKYEIDPIYILGCDQPRRIYWATHAEIKIAEAAIPKGMVEAEGWKNEVWAMVRNQLANRKAA